jgi:hypothetical protein
VNNLVNGYIIKMLKENNFNYVLNVTILARNNKHAKIIYTVNTASLLFVNFVEVNILIIT